MTTKTEQNKGEKMNKTIMCLAILAVMLVSCAPKEVQPVKIGVSLTLTGPAASTGNWMKNGIELALERLPPEQREKVQVIFEDDQCSPQLGLTIGKKFVEIENTQFMIGPLCGSVVSPTMDYYEQNKVLRMIQGWGLDSYEGKGKYYFVPLGHVKQMMQTIAEYAIVNNYKKVGVIYRDDDYGKDNQKYFEMYFKQNGGSIIASEPYAAGATDFRTQLLKLQQANPDAIFIAARGTDLVNVLKQMDEMKFNVQKFGMYNAQDSDVVKAVGNLADGMIYPHITPTTSEVRTWYVQRYTEKYGVPPEFISATTFDSFNILLNTIKECNQNVDCVQQKISAIRTYDGASGNFAIDETGFGIRQPAIKTIRDGKFEFLK
jgi:branched-chain amino acid transport system substrate-binding protein